LRRVVAAAVILLGLGTALMTFPELRTFGASLLASAGLAGIVAGLAAQTTLANIFAGLQLAFTDAVRIDDVVVVEDEWGWIEEITLTYVVLHIWDERRLVLPTSYFTTTPFQNWTRTQARVLGAVTLYLDYATPLTALREHAEAVIAASSRWDRRDWVLQVTDTTETTMVVRVLASAVDAPTAWDLRCEIREALLTFLQENHPESLPVQRVLIDPAPGSTGPTPDPPPANQNADPAVTALPVHPNLGVAAAVRE
jgi:small-conductance mechanosensitive channel